MNKNKLNYGEFRLLMDMALGYRIAYLDDGVVTATLNKGDFNEMEMMYAFSTAEDIDEQASAMFKTEMLNKIKDSVNKSTFEDNKEKISNLYDNRDYRTIWNLLVGRKEGQVTYCGLFNLKAMKNFIKYNHPDYVNKKLKEKETNIGVLENLEGPYFVYKNGQPTYVTENPYKNVISTVYSSMNMMGEQLMLNSIFKNADKGIYVDSALYDKNESMRFWRTPKWRKQLRKERKLNGDVAKQVSAKSQTKSVKTIDNSRER